MELKAAVLSLLAVAAMFSSTQAEIQSALAPAKCALFCPAPQVLIGCRCVNPLPICPAIACPLRSRLACSVYKKDARGCQTCQCLCPLLSVCPANCKYGVEHGVDSNGCRTCKCKPAPICPLVLCRDPCPGGFRKDKNGCQTCECVPKICPPVCKIGCPYGNVLDSNGCPICRCKPKPVDCGPVCLIFCRNGNVLDERGCPTCRCKPDPFDCGPVCLIFCPNGNVLDERGCPTCRCKPGPIDRLLLEPSPK